MCVLVMVYLDWPVNKDIGISYGTRKWVFAQDVWEAQNPVDVLSVLPVNVREIMKDFYIFKRPLNVMWAFLRMTIGLPIELVIKIMTPSNRQWKIFVPRPMPLTIGETHVHLGNPWKTGQYYGS